MSNRINPVSAAIARIFVIMAAAFCAAVWMIFAYLAGGSSMTVFGVGLFAFVVSGVAISMLASEHP
jgi:hypothetical protein